MDNSSFDIEQIEPTLDPSCHEVDKYQVEIRFWLAGMVGIVLSLISICFNSFIFAVFVTSKQHRNSYNLYLLLLAIFDFFMGISYIAVISMRVIINKTGSYELKSIWIVYMVPMLTVSHIALTASTYLITFAAIERYCITVKNGAVTLMQKSRVLLAFAAVLAGVISKGTILEEIEVVVNPECISGVNEWGLDASALVKENPLFNKYWRFYFRNIFTIIAPFFILLSLNAKLIFRINFPDRSTILKEEREDKQSLKQNKARIRNATQSLVILVCTYLMSNLLAVIITIWEHVDYESLSKDYTPFYVLSVDAISLLTILAACLRLPIYMGCQPLLRKEMVLFARSIISGKKMASRKMTLIETQQVAQQSLLPLDSEAATPLNTKIEFV